MDQEKINQENLLKKQHQLHKKRKDAQKVQEKINQEIVKKLTNKIYPKENHIQNHQNALS